MLCRRLLFRHTALALQAKLEVVGAVETDEVAQPEGGLQPNESTVVVTGGHSGKSLPEAVAGLPFRFQMVELKRHARGVAQRPQNLAFAKTILERCIPHTASDLKEWLTEDNAATALNGCTFFELPIPHQQAISTWALDNAASFKTPFNMASTAMSLLQLHHDDDSIVERISTELVPPLREQLSELRGDTFHSTVKLFQRLHIEDEDLWNSVCTEIKKRENQIARNDSTAIRLFSCVARHAPANDVTRELFGFLVSRVGEFKSYDFTTFLSGAERWGRLSLQDALPLLRRQGERTQFNNARDLGVCFPACVRISHAFTADKTLSDADALVLAQHLHFIFDACEAHVQRCMDPSQVDHYWSKPSDIISALYAYDSSNRSPPGLLTAFATYAKSLLDTMTGRDVAMSLGVLRRTGYLTEQFLTAATPAIERALADEMITIEEASHIALSLVAVAPASNSKLLAQVEKYIQAHWKSANDEDASVIYGGHPHSEVFATLNVVAALKPNKLYSVPADLSEVAVRQLVDVRSHGVQKEGKAAADKELVQRIQARSLRDSDLALVATHAQKPDDPLRRPAQAAVNEALDRPNWGPYHLELLASSNKLDKTEYAARAIQLGRDLAVSPQQLIHVIENLGKVFSDRPELAALVKDGAAQLSRTSLRYSLLLARQLSQLKTPIALDAEFYRTMIQLPTSRGARRIPVPELTAALELARAHSALKNLADHPKVKTAVTFIVKGAGPDRLAVPPTQEELSAFKKVVVAIDPALATDELENAIKAAPKNTERDQVNAKKRAEKQKKEAEEEEAVSKTAKSKKAAAAGKGKPAAGKPAAKKLAAKTASKAAPAKKPAAKKK
jgi:hypothetical protein